jgi:putative Mg2+ transporter-C (MgtC) family protein
MAAFQGSLKSALHLICHHALHLAWTDIALRLALTLVAGGLIGFNREEQGRSAGLRTTMLVSLAAALSMVLVNLMLPIDGKTPSSFVVMDLMRLPLGILSGMGFIGAGAILHRGPLVTGVTTAATLWFSTMMGLCFGAGQLALGLAALLLALLILRTLKTVEHRFSRAAQGTLTVAGRDRPQEEIARRIADGGGRLFAWSETRLDHDGGWQRGRVSWSMPHERNAIPPFVQSLSRIPGITRVEWRMIDHIT